MIVAPLALSATPPEIQASLATILKPTMPAVVNIAAQGEIMVSVDTKTKRKHSGKYPDSENDDQNNNNDNENDNNDTPIPYGALREFASLGSGVIISAKKGYIITNAHVVNKAKTITVTLSDGRNFKAKLIGTDPITDIALIQITAEKLTEMPIGDSEKLQVGDYVIAIGNPFGLTQTATSGIISALRRGSLGIEGPEGVENFIQTDASINPGNSGGALVNMQGQLIGINTAILSPEGGNIGIGFAIPINMAKVVVSQLVQYGSVKRGLMGIIVQTLTPDLANAFGINHETGALITQISPHSPAEKAGLKAGDVIQQLNHQAMKTAADVRNAVGLLRVGTKISLQILRQGKTMTLELVTDDPVKYLENAKHENSFLFGLSLKNFDQEMPLQGYITGVQVVHVSKNSPAWRAGLMRGDVIISANQIPVNTVLSLQKACATNKKQLLLNIIRGNGAMFIIVD